MTYLGLLLVFVFEYMRPGSYIPGIGIFNSILPLGMFALSIVTASRFTTSEILFHRNTKWLLYFLFLIGLSTAFTAEVQMYSYQKFTQVFGYLLLYYIFVRFTTSLDRLKVFFATLAAIHVGLMILNPDVILKPESRSYIQGVTFLGDGNDFALSVVIAVPLCLFLVQDAKSKLVKLTSLSFLVVLLMSIVGTSSRGAAIGISVVMLYLWFKSRNKIVGVAILIALAIGVFSFAPDYYFQRMETVADYETEGSAQGRLKAWAAAIRMAQDHPLSGVGSGQFGMMYSNRYRPPDYEYDTMRWLTAHSIYFLTLGELGLPGLLFLYAIIFGTLIRNERRLRQLKQVPESSRETHRRLLICTNSSLIGFGVAGAFLSAIYYPHIYVITAIMTVVSFFHNEHLKTTATDLNQASEPLAQDRSAEQT